MHGFTKIAPRVWGWSRFSNEKGLNFNGTALLADGKAVLVDPVPLDETQWKSLRSEAAVLGILLTNKDHERAAFEIAREAGVDVWIHEADADRLREKAAQKFKHYDRLPLGVVPIHLGHLKSPGECAFYWKYGTEPGVMILGDALIGKPKGELSLLPSEKVPEPKFALESLRALRHFSFETLIVGDGEGFATGGKEAFSLNLERLLRADA